MAQWAHPAFIGYPASGSDLAMITGPADHGAGLPDIGPWAGAAAAAGTGSPPLLPASVPPTED